jgi:ABC-type multidrug transport system ATPase subunit
MSHEAKERRVRETMIELGLEHIANTRIGTPGRRGISGGEKRRVSIAMEVVTGPSILYLDEPTSGLDSYNALSVVQSLVTLAKRYNRTIILTIHQPRSNIFAMFDKLLLLAEGGYMVYSGPIYGLTPVAEESKPAGSSRNETPTPQTASRVPILSNWLSDIGVSCPRGFNMADYLIDLTKTGGSEFSSDLNIMGFGQESSMTSIRHRKTNASTTSAASSPKRSHPMPISTAATAHIEMNPSDLQELAQQRHHLQHIVSSFVRSDVCRSLKDEIDQQLGSVNILPQTGSAALNITAGMASSPSITNDADAMDESLPLMNAAANTNSPFFAVDPNSSEAEDAAAAPGRAPTRSANLSRQFSSYFSSLSQLTRSGGGRTKSLRPTFWTQFVILSRRTFTNFYRNPMLMWSHYGVSITVACTFSTLLLVII